MVYTFIAPRGPQDMPSQYIANELNIEYGRKIRHLIIIINSYVNLFSAT